MRLKIKRRRRERASKSFKSPAAEEEEKMKKWMLAALLPALMSVFAHSYLARRHYELQAGEFRESAICHVSEKINCDPALLSPYGKLLGISISNFGIGFNIILCLILIMFLLFPPRPGESGFWKQTSFYLSGAIALASLAMLSLSFALDLYCPVCLILYVLSFMPPAALFFAFRGDVYPLRPLIFAQKFFLGADEPEKPAASAPPAAEKSASRGENPRQSAGPSAGGRGGIWRVWRPGRDRRGLFIMGGLLAASFFVHMAFINSFGYSEEAEAAFADWRTEKPRRFSEAPVLAFGQAAGLRFLDKKAPAETSKPPKVLIVEFADFLCPYCRQIEPVLKGFLRAHKGAALHFYIYPLDRACNPAMEHGGSGASCELGRALICGAGQKRGAQMHDLIFKRQEDFKAAYADSEKISRLLKETAKEAQLDLSQFSLCMKSPEAREKLRLSAKAGNDAGVKGAPFLYVNGKRLRAGAKTLLPLLSRIYNQKK